MTGRGLQTIELTLSVKSLQTPLVCDWPRRLRQASVAGAAWPLALANTGSPREIGVVEDLRRKALMLKFIT